MSNARIFGTVIASVVALYAISLLLQTWFIDRTQSRYVGAAMFAQALSEASLVRRYVDTHYAETGELPANNQAIGLGPPASFANGALAALEVRDGHIILTLDQDDMDGAVAVIRVERSRSGVGGALKWRCESADLGASFLKTSGSQCRHVEAVVLDQPLPAPVETVHSTESLISALHLRRKTLALEIIRSGINLNAPHQGLYPLEMAIEDGDSRLALAMLKAGADPNQRMSRREDVTMLGWASQSHRRSAQILRALIKAGGQLEARDAAGRTPLMLAARAGNVTLLEALLKSGAELEAVDHKGNTAANYAASHGTSSSIYTRLSSEKNKRNEIIVILPER